MRTTPDKAFEVEAQGQKKASSASGSSWTASLLNLLKNIMGSGMLCLPFAMKCAGIVPFVFGIILIGAIKAYTFFLIGYCSHKCGAKTFGELWAKTFGEGSAWIGDLSVLLNNGMACLAYCVLMGDFLSKSLGVFLPSINSRSTDLVTVGVFMLLPLSLLRDLAPLRFSSLAGLLATLYTFLLLTSDCAAGVNLWDLKGPMRGNLFPVRIDFFQAWALLSSAFMAHYNAPKFFNELQDNTVPRFAALVVFGYGVSLLVFLVFAFCGFALFGFGVEGNVLNNYKGNTMEMLAWLGMAFSVVFTYPLVFSSFRDAAARILSFYGLIDNAAGIGFHRCFTVAAVGATVAGGIHFQDVSFVNSVKGAVLSACLAFIFPASIHLHLSAQLKDRFPVGRLGQLMRMFSYCIIVTGALTGTIALLVIFVLPKTDFSRFANPGPPRP